MICRGLLAAWCTCAAAPVVWAQAPPPQPPPVEAAIDAEADANARAADDQPIDYSSARARLKEVLARREFQNQDNQRWADALRMRIAKWIDRVLERLGANTSSAALLGRVLAWTVAIAALLVASIWLFRGRRARGRADAQIAFDVPRLSSREWAARAREALAAGDAKEALRCAYHAVLFRIEEQGTWRVDESRTPREYLSLLRADDDRRAAFADLTRDFERTWYGSQLARVDDLAARLEVLGCPMGYALPSDPTT